MANISDLLQMLKQKEKPHKKSRFDDLENCKSLIIGEYKNGKSINQIVDELRLKCGLKTTRKRVSEFLKQLGGALDC
jgi:transposase